jgi:uracil phosphoribosyltransferase
MNNTTVVDHPLIAHKLTMMRRKETETALFRRLMREVALLLGFEATRALPVGTMSIETPLQPMDAPELSGRTVALISILRAGNGFLDGMLDLMPNAKVGFVGLSRNEETLQPFEYLFNVPPDLDQRPVIVLDPMLATGNSSIAAVDRIKKAGAKRLRFVCLLAAPEGIAAFEAAHPDVPIIAAAVDECLNDSGYILPGIGDAGDRLFGTV